MPSRERCSRSNVPGPVWRHVRAQHLEISEWVNYGPMERDGDARESEGRE